MTQLRLFLVAIFVSTIALVIESVLLAIGLPVELIPELVLVFVVYLSFFQTNSYGALLAFMCGLMIDMSSGHLLGPWAGAYVLAFGVISIISDRIFVESSISLSTVAALLTLLTHVIYLLISMDSFSELYSAGMLLFGKALCTALVTPLFFPLLRRVLRFSQGEPSTIGRMRRTISS